MNTHQNPNQEQPRNEYRNICFEDTPAMEDLHTTLIRRSTCANGSVCDYRIVRDRSDTAKAHPRRTDENGYWYND